MRICKAKADMKNNTRVEVSIRNHPTMDCTVLDGCAILWLVPWPASSEARPATVLDFVKAFKGQVQKHLKSGEVYLDFDRYVQYSIKCSARKARGSGSCRVFQLSPLSPLPPQSQILNSPDNKKQLVQIIVDTFKADQDILGGHKHKLVITGQDEVPIEISPGGIIIDREDMRTSHEEADVIVVAHAIYAAQVEKKQVIIIADDADIYALLLYHYLDQGLDKPMLMQSTKKGRAVIDIKATVSKLADIIPNLLQAHALTGCDTVAMCHGIGKGKMLKTLKSGRYSLRLLGDQTADFNDVILQSTAFMSACYSIHDATCMTASRITAWLSKTGKKIVTGTPKLCSLPPTRDAFTENVKRAHYQCCIWRQALHDPPNLDPTQYGWMKEEQSTSLQPITLPTAVQPAPDYILKMVRCSCSSNTPCRSKACGCNTAHMACTLFCSCQGGVECANQHTKAVAELDDQDD